MEYYSYKISYLSYSSNFKYSTTPQFLYSKNEQTIKSMLENPHDIIIANSLYFIFSKKD